MKAFFLEIFPVGLCVFGKSIENDAVMYVCEPSVR
jgi:hypothetical protein